jgi:hypothetical protein
MPLTPNDPAVAAGTTPFPDKIDSYQVRATLEARIVALEDLYQKSHARMERLGSAIGVGFVQGGAVSSTAGLTLELTPIKAIVDQYVDSDGAPVVVNVVGHDNKARVNLWLRSNGTITPRSLDNLSPAGDGAGSALLICHFATNSPAGSISGVVDDRVAFGAGFPRAIAA